MMKFFRKHNKKLLAIFMALLLVVWLGGSALTDMLHRRVGGEVLATSDLGDITAQDVQHADGLTELMARAGISWESRLGMRAAGTLLPLHWVLLTREAEAMDVRANPAVIAAALEQQGSMEFIKAVAHQSRQKADVIVGGLAQLTAIQELGQKVAMAGVPSEAEIRTAARDELEQVEVRAALIPAVAFRAKQGTEEEYQPTEEELQVHFEAYRDKEPGRGGIEFGYHLPSSVRIQYIKIARGVVEEHLRLKEETIERDARRFYQQERENNPMFRRPPEPPKEDEKEDGADDLTSAPDDAPEAEKPVYVDWEDAREKAIAAVRENHADEAVSRIANALRASLAEPWGQAETDPETFYKRVPEGVDQLLHYQKQVETLPKSIAYPEAVTVDATDFFTAAQSRIIEGIGGAQSVMGGSKRLAQLAFDVQGLAEIPRDRVEDHEFLSLYQTSTHVLRDSRTGDRYLFRVIEVNADHPAETLEEVRERVVNDVRQLRAYEQAKACAERLLEAARTKGLQEAYDTDEEIQLLKTQYETQAREMQLLVPQPFSRSGSARFRAYARAMSGIVMVEGLGAIDRETVEGIFALGQAEHPYGLFEQKTNGRILVVEWLKTTPVREDEFAGKREELAKRLRDDRWQQAWANWFDPDNIRTRHNFEPVERR